MSSENTDQIKRTEKISFTFDDQTVEAYDGETIAAALLRRGVIHLRNAPNSNTARGMFCGMGVCQECVVEVDGYKVEACRTKTSNGLIVKKVSYV
ncbi:MAG: (2Fe-2S)-binding protein [Kordiimonadaceae bacterium]|jgi:D-hydroxyproline dehydrogenase subunit gamma|nr:(2Fe-2S)-binding protein [Kordiimonadaceae bacterium]MBT6031159.1 (2Fe-2S)-binding protein [Kordiimonadaceae bacterium]